MRRAIPISTIKSPGTAVLRSPRVSQLLVAAFLSRAAVAASPLALLVALASVYGFATAGLIDGVYTLILALFGPLRARILDHFQPRTSLFVMGAVALSSMAGVSIVIAEKGPWWAALALIVLSGLTMPPLNAALRVSWRQTVQGDEQLKVVHTADSIVEELAFVTGPALAGLGFVLLSDTTAYVAVIALIAVALALFLVVTWRYDLGRRPSQQDGGDTSLTSTPVVQSPPLLATLRRLIGPWAYSKMFFIACPLFAMGFVFGGLGVYVPAYAASLGSVGWSGVILALISVGGVIGGIVYGSKRWDIPLWARYRWLILAFLIPCVFMVFASPLWALGVLIFLCGLSVTPVLSSAFLLVDDELPITVRHEATAWVGASTDLTNGISAIIVGSLVANQRWSTALLVIGAVSLACLLAIMSLWSRRTTSWSAKDTHAHAE